MISRYSECFPVGLALCTKHYKMETTKEVVPIVLVTEPVEEDTVVEEIDPEYQPEGEPVFDEVHDISIRSGDDITAVLDTSPIRHQLKRKFNHVDSNTKQQLIWKYERMEKALK